MGDLSSCVCDYLNLEMRKGKAVSAVLGISSQIFLPLSLLGKRKSEIKFSLEREYVLAQTYHSPNIILL